MQPDNSPENSHLYRFLAENGVFNVGPYGFPAMQSLCSSSSSSYHNYPLEGSVITDMTPQDRALAALKNHKEAEKRRRERINSHLDKLRNLLPCNSKVNYGWFVFVFDRVQFQAVWWFFKLVWSFWLGFNGGDCEFFFCALFLYSVFICGNCWRFDQCVLSLYQLLCLFTVC